MILKDIAPIPSFSVFGVQWDVFDREGCGFGYPQGLLEYMNEYPRLAHEKLIKWYGTYGQHIHQEILKRADQTDCENKYGIKYKLTMAHDHEDSTTNILILKEGQWDSLKNILTIEKR